MLKFLKDLFKKKEIPIEDISPGAMVKWFEGKVKEIEKSASVRIDSLKKQFLSSITDAGHVLKTLGEATLRNSNIPIRELHMMEGNRKSYLQRTERFFSEIKDITHYETVFFLNHYQEYLDNFMKSTSRAYSILSHFFGDEVSKVSSTIKQIDSVVDDMKGDKGVHSQNKVDAIRKEFSSIESRLNRKKELELEISTLKDQLTGLKKKSESMEGKKKDILSSNEYGQLQVLMKTSKHIDEESRQLRNLFMQKFSTLTRPLKKYQHMKTRYSKLAEHYILDPLNALSTDAPLNIIKILDEVRDAIKDGKISVKDKSASKVLNVISSLDKKYFDDLAESYKKLKVQMQENSRQIDSCRIGEEIDNVEADIDRNNKEVSSVKRHLASLKEEMDSIDIEKAREKVRTDIEKLLGIKINFILKGANT